MSSLPMSVQTLLKGCALAAMLALWQMLPAHAEPAVTPVDIGATTARQDAPLELRFDAFFKLPVGPAGLEISPLLLQSHGRLVRLTGFMVQQEVPTPGTFMLTPRPVQMSENADGDADDLPPATVLVKLDPSQSDWALAHARGRIAVEGVLDVGREEGRNGRVSWVRLQLAPDALRAMNAWEMASYLHARAHRH